MNISLNNDRLSTLFSINIDFIRLTSCFTSTGLTSTLTIVLGNIYGCTISNDKTTLKRKVSGKFEYASPDHTKLFPEIHTWT